jgi:hypothetical protein
MDVICGSTSCRLALRIQTEPTPAEGSAGRSLASNGDRRGCADMQREACTAEELFTASISFGG